MDSKARILVVDDDKGIRDVLRGGLASEGYLVDTAESAAVARVKFKAGGFDLVLCDIDMPGEPGTELLPWLRQQDPLIAVMMVTGLDDAGTAVDAMRDGACDYLCKPFSLPEVFARTKQALENRENAVKVREHQDRLEQLVEVRTQHLRDAIERIRSLNADLSHAYDNTLSALMIALDYRDNETQGHSLRVVAYTDRLARELGLEEPVLTAIRRGAMLHDVGKIGIADSILRKPGPLDEQERQIMRLHPRLGYDMLTGIGFLEQPAEIVLTHQEKWDGSGYPRGLRQEEIPIGARIFGVADTFDAMTSDRPYRSALPFAKVREELMEFAGVQFDPRVVEAFLRVPESEWWLIRDQVQRDVAARKDAGIPESLFRRVASGGVDD